MDGFETLASGEQVPIVAPLYYGMLAMARTLRGGAAPIEVQTLRKVEGVINSAVQSALLRVGRAGWDVGGGVRRPGG